MTKMGFSFFSKYISELFFANFCCREGMFCPIYSAWKRHRWQGVIRTLLRIWWGFLQKQLTTYYFHKKVSIIDIWHTSLMFFKKYWKIRWKTPVLEPFFNKVETRAQVLYCEFWELCKNTFLVEHLRSLPLSIHLWTTKIVFAITIKKTIHYTWVINLFFPLIQD